MSTKENGVSKVVTAENTNAHTEAAQQRLQELRTTRELIPYFSAPQSVQELRRISNVASVPPEFVELTAVAVSNEKPLERPEGLTPAEIRDLMRYAEAYGPYADELEAFAQLVRYSVNAARYAAGSEALAVYAIAQRLVKLPKTARLAPTVADMRRTLGRTRKAKPETVAKKAAAKAEKATAMAAEATEQAVTAVRKAAKAAPKLPVVTIKE
jgi:hypothetical protein